MTLMEEHLVEDTGWSVKMPKTQESNSQAPGRPAEVSCRPLLLDVCWHCLIAHKVVDVALEEAKSMHEVLVQVSCAIRSSWEKLARVKALENKLLDHDLGRHNPPEDDHLA